MTLSDLSALGSFISGIAVVISFVFLGLQIRQADKNQKAMLVNDSASRATEHLLKLTEPHIADLYRRMVEGHTDFTETELIQLMNIMSAMLNSVADLEVRRVMSMADKDSIESTDNVARWMFSLAVPRALWPLIRQTFSSGLREHVENIMRDTPIRRPPSFNSILKANLAKLGPIADN